MAYNLAPIESINLSPIESIKDAWRNTYGVKGSFWAALVITAVIMLGINLVQHLMKIYNPPLVWPVSLISLVVNFLLQMGAIYMGIRRAQVLPINYKMVFYTFNWTLASKLIATYCLQILIMIPFVVLIVLWLMLPEYLFVPGKFIIRGVLLALTFIAIIYVALRMMFALLLIVDKSVYPVTAIKSSFKMTRNNVLALFYTLFLEMLIFIVSCIPLGIGLIWTLPFSFVLLGTLYRQLLTNLKTI